MKYYTFFPGLVIAFAFAVLLTLTKAFHLNVPLLKEIRNPLVALVISGFLLCAFGTLTHFMSAMFTSGKIDWQVIGMAAIGVLLLIISGLAIFSDKPIFGLFSQNASYYVIASLIAVKIVISTVRVIRLS